MSTKVTPTTKRALFILSLTDGCTPAEFARHMWPDSPAWNRVYHCGPNGATRGRGIVKSAGSYLAKLCQRGLICQHSLHHDRSGPLVYAPTQAGHDALRKRVRP